MVADRAIPTLDRESALWAAGIGTVAGLDEAGRGSLAGPVVAAAVVVAPAAKLEGVWTRVRDSKMLRPSQREQLECEIHDVAAAWSVGVSSPQEIDRLGIAPATRTAMVRAVSGLAIVPEHLLIDWVRLTELDIAQTSWAKADQASVSVAAASILAKVWRDRFMTRLGDDYPNYRFERHKGYGTAAHRAALEQYGPCVEHRFTFAPVSQSRGLYESAVDSKRGNRTP